MRKILFFILFLSGIANAQPSAYWWSLLNNDNGVPPPSSLRTGIIFQSTTVNVPGFKQAIPTQIGPSIEEEREMLSGNVEAPDAG